MDSGPLIRTIPIPEALMAVEIAAIVVSIIICPFITGCLQPFISALKQVFIKKMLFTLSLRITFFYLLSIIFLILLPHDGRDLRLRSLSPRIYFPEERNG